MKEKELKESNTKGITLIALIITIIVMLILVGVTVSVAINGGLFANAKHAKAETQNEINSENELSEGKVNIDGKIYNSMQDYLDGKELIVGNWTLSEAGDTVTDGKVTLKIGDYINYTSDEGTYPQIKLTDQYTGSTENNSDLVTNTSLKWRVLGVDTYGFLTLISDKSVSDIKIHFDNAVGYNNGVYILNDICAKLYSNSDLGITARSINIEDVESGYSDIGNNERNNYKNDKSDTQYGKTKSYTSGLNYPVLYAEENGSGIEVTEDKVATDIKTSGIGRSVSYYNENQLTNKSEGKESDTASKVLTSTQTYYQLSPSSTDYCKNSTFYDMIFGEGLDYWLASRVIFCNDYYVAFGLHGISAYGLRGGTFYFSVDNNNPYSPFFGLRPVISLSSNIKVTKCEGDANGEDTTHMHNLSKSE